METLTAIGTIVGIALVQIIRDWRDGKHVFKRNGSAESVKMLREMRAAQDKLQLHFNEETTTLLEQIRDGVNKSNTTLQEFKEYGVKQRK